MKLTSLFIAFCFRVFFENSVCAQKCTQTLSQLEKIVGATNDDKEDRIFAQGYYFVKQDEISGHTVRMYSKCWDEVWYELWIIWDLTDNTIIFNPKYPSVFYSVKLEIKAKCKAKPITIGDYSVYSYKKYHYGLIESVVDGNQKLEIKLSIK